MSYAVNDLSYTFILFIKKPVIIHMKFSPLTQSIDFSNFVIILDEVNYLGMDFKLYLNICRGANVGKR